MQVDTKALAENLREIAKRPSLGTFARGFVETAADGLLALDADNERLADGLVRYRSALNRIRDTIEEQGEFDKEGGFHLDNVPACIVAKALLGLEERGDPAPRPDNLNALYAGEGGEPYGEGGGGMTASVTFVCHHDGRVTPDLWADPHATDAGNQNAVAIERLVRVCMRAQGAHREAIEAAVNAAEKEQKEQK